jgi:hypothetical protein
MEVLTAFLRENTRWRRETAAKETEKTRGVEPERWLFQPTADFQAVATALGRRDRRHERPDYRLYLSGVDLRGALLREAELSKADLDLADLSFAHLFGANLSGANLSGANLSGAILFEANFSAAILSEANFSGADIGGAVLEDAFGLAKGQLATSKDRFVD